MKYRYGWAFPDADEFMAGEIKPDGSYQASHYTMAMRYVKDRTLALDGGAHVGTWTRLMAADFQAVIAVEPSADTFAALTENLRTLGVTNVDARNLALGAAPGRVDMVLDGRAVELKNTGARHVREDLDGTVERQTIDSWHLETLGFLKLDVEGSEPFVLAGARETLRRCRPIVLFEDKQLWRRYGQASDAPEVILRSLGYRMIIRAGCDRIYGPA